MGNYIALSRQSLRGTALASLIGLCASLWTLTATADIRFEDKSEGRGERFSLDVRNEPIAKVIDRLSERYDFAVDGYPEHWSKDPMNFSATGDLERVLRSLLKDTSHVFEYHTNLQTQETRIAALKLLNEGVEGFVASSPRPRTTFTDEGNAITRGSGNRRPGQLADRVTANQSSGDQAQSSSNATPNSATPPVQVSGLSRSLEQRARQSAAATANPGTAEPASKATPAPADPSVPNADMQALTRKALQDVQGLAEALRKAERSGSN